MEEVRKQGKKVSQRIEGVGYGVDSGAVSKFIGEPLYELLCESLWTGIKSKRYAW